MKPTVGRKVWYFPGPGDEMMHRNLSDPLDATIIAVHNDVIINAFIIDASGFSHVRHSVELLDPADPTIPNNGHCEWMPYQIGQAAKTEELQAKLNNS